MNPFRHAEHQGKQSGPSLPQSTALRVSQLHALQIAGSLFSSECVPLMFFGLGYLDDGSLGTPFTAKENDGYASSARVLPCARGA